MIVEEIFKTSNEKFAIGFTYICPDLEEDQTITNVVVTITPSETDGLEKVGDVVIDGNEVSQVIQSGIDGNDYYVVFKTTTSIAHVYEDALIVKIRNITE